MENAITILLFVFIIVVLVIALFCVVIVTRDVILESRENRKSQPVVASSVVEVQKPVEEKKEVQKEQAPAPTVTEPVQQVDDSNVKFDAIKKTRDEKYHELPAAFRLYYDEIVKTAMSVENSKRYKNDNYEEYKLGKSRLVRLKIKRETVIAELLIPNLTLKEYISDNKVEAKLAPTVIKVEDQASLDAVKDSIAIAVKVYEEERQLKKEQAKEKRRLAREAAKK